MVNWKLPWRNRSVKTVPPEIGDRSLIVVAEGSDDSVASSVALADAGFDGAEPVVLRLILSIPDVERETVVNRCIAEGYGIDGGVSVETSDGGTVTVAVAQVRMVDAVVLSRSRARMASIVSRAGGDVLGWALLGRPDTPMTEARDGR